MAYPMTYGRPSHFYDFRPPPPPPPPPSAAPFHRGGLHRPQTEFHRSRPNKLTPRVLNRNFKKVTIQLNEHKVLVISVQQLGKAKMSHLVFSQCEGSYENKTDTVSVPEPLVVPLVQQLHKLSKWRPSTSSSRPSGQALTFEDVVFRSQIVGLSEESTPPDARLHAVKIFAESRAKNPQDRKELSRVLIPLETNHLMKVKDAMNDVLIVSVDSPLYHTISHHGSDGSKFYLDLIRDADAHYLKISQVTREFRSILHVPADDLEAVKTHLDSCLAAMKTQEEQKVKKKKNRQSRRRRRRSEGKQTGSNKEAVDKKVEEEAEKEKDKEEKDKEETDKEEKDKEEKDKEEKDKEEKDKEEKDKKAEEADEKSQDNQQKEIAAEDPKEQPPAADSQVEA